MFRHGRSSLRARAKPIMHLHTSAVVYAFWWLGLLLLHGANLVYYAGVAKLYRSFDNSYLYFQLRTYRIGLPPEGHPTVSRIHACIAALHVFFIVLMIGSSLYARKLVFQPELKAIVGGLMRLPIVGPFLTRSISATSRPSSPTHGSGTLSRTSSATLTRRVSESMRKGGQLFARDGLLGVDSVYFDHVVLVRELVETTLQTIQLYRMTLVLPRLWLIRFYVALLVLNCWAVPFLHRMYRDRETTRRILCLLCDAVLDMLSSIGVSIVIFAAYAPQYNDPNGWGFPILTWFDDTWFSNVQQEFQIMMVSSWGDMISRLVFALGLLQCMEAIKEMLAPVAPPKGPHKVHVSSPPVPIAPVANGLAAPTVLLEKTDDVMPVDRAKDEEPQTRLPETVAADATPGIAPDTTNSVEADPVARPPPSCHKVAKAPLLPRVVEIIVHGVGPGLFVLWGCVILAMHIAAESHHTDSACLLRLKPWFSTKPGCSLVEINCATLHSNGQDGAMDAAWDVFDPDRAARVVIRHCAQLVVSPKIQLYHKMTGFKVYNATIVDWREAAALTETHHSGLRSVLLLHSLVPNGELPPGLVSTDFPKRMTNFFTAATNLQSLPPDLDTKWPKNMQLLFESSLFTEIPTVVTRLAPNVVSMAGAPVDAVSTALLESPNLTVLQMGLTRIQELPATVQRINPVFMGLFLQFTNVTVFPAYLNRYASFSLRYFPVHLFNAFGTPYCRELGEIAAGTRQAFTNATAPNAVLMDVSTPEKRAFVELVVDCSGPGLLFYYPLPIEDKKHGLR